MGKFIFSFPNMEKKFSQLATSSLRKRQIHRKKNRQRDIENKKERESDPLPVAVSADTRISSYCTNIICSLRDPTFPCSEPAGRGLEPAWKASKLAEGLVAD